jgi:hypothetical protein
MSNEKFDEKELEKQEEKSSEEKDADEKWRRDPLGSVIWAAILVWAGIALLFNNLGFLDALQRSWANLPGFSILARLDVWALVFFGAGLLLLGEVLLRTLIPDYRRPVGGTLFLGFLALGISLSSVVGWDIVWPLIVIGIGAFILLRGLLRR